jgi:hypothetical protein
MPLPAGYTEAQAPELFRFDKKGDHIEGIFTHAKTEKINGDDVLELYINTGRRVVRVRPGWDVKSKINRSMVGKMLYLEYYGDDESKGKDGNPLKVFHVGSKVAPPRAAGDDPGITDDDIPF